MMRLQLFYSLPRHWMMHGEPSGKVHFFATRITAWLAAVGVVGAYRVTFAVDGVTLTVDVELLGATV